MIDLKGGEVVHARAGARGAYQPIQTPLGPAGDAIAIARALLAVTASPLLYVADLDAIEGHGTHFELCRALSDALPGTTLWIDAGFSSLTDCAFWLPLGTTLVIGSESIATIEIWQELRASLGESLVLSLDFAMDGLRGPQAFLSEPALWPDRIIVMCLTRLGTDRGPDIARLKAVVAQAGARAVYAAGGVRGVSDIEAIAAAGASGALIATALHARAIVQNEIAAFQGRRRSRLDQIRNPAS